MNTKKISGKHKYKIIFEIILFIFIVISVGVVILESVQSIQNQYKYQINVIEFVVSLFFTCEYIGRIILAKNKRAYIFSFMGIIDLVSIIPFYISFISFDATSISIIRAIRLIRIFRVLKLTQFLGQEKLLINAIKSNLNKVIVFLLFISVVIIIFGTTMYFIEGEENGFTSIPKGIYWAIVTLTTVGYGDIAPKTILGQVISSIIMIFGYAIIAVPTGIIINDLRDKKQKCHHCYYTKNSIDNNFCGNCGKKI